MPIGMAVGLLKWMISDFIFFSTRQVGNIRISAMRTKDRALLYAFKSFWMLLHIVLPTYYNGFGNAVACAFTVMIIGAYYIENIFVVNHIQDGLVPDASVHWADKQILGTANWGSVCFCLGMASPDAQTSFSLSIPPSSLSMQASHFWNFFSGGLNHQIEHHLFPAMNPYLYPFISPIVKQCCEEHKLPYQNFSSFASAWWAMISYLYALGHPESESSVAKSTPVAPAANKKRVKAA